MTFTAARLGRVVAKELKETLRDRRTIVTLMLMPLLVYPLLGLTVQQLLMSSAGPANDVSYVFAFKDDATRFHFANIMERAGPPEEVPTDSLLPGPARKAGKPRIVKAMDFGRLVDPAEGAELVAQGNIHAYLTLQPIARPRREEIAIDFVAVVPAGAPTAPMDYVRRRMRMAALNTLSQRLIGSGVPQRPEPFQFTTTTVPSTETPTGFLLAALLPLVLIVTTITGAVYPAIDLTAGERERNTLEVLMAAPIPRHALLLAKYAAVVTVAMLTAIVNLVAMATTIWLGDLGPALLGPAPLNPLVIAVALVALALFAAFFSAVLLALSSFARSFKEAQSYLIPLMVVSLVPGLAGMLPALSLTPATATVPILNIVLLARELLLTGRPPLEAVLVLLSTALYAVAALVLAARLFGSEQVLYGTGLTSWSGLFARPARPTGPVATETGLLVVVAMLPLFLLCGAAADRFSQGEPIMAMTLRAVANLVIFAGLPLFAVWHRRADGVLNVSPSPVAGWLAAALLGVSLWPFAIELNRLQEQLGWITLSAEVRAALKSLSETLRQLPFPVLFILLAVVPAVSEEVCFRGFLFAALDRPGRHARAILGTAVVFGLFHVVSLHGVTPGRFLPTMLLGVVLGWLRAKTGSLGPGVLFHMCNNGLMAYLIHSGDQVELPGAGSWKEGDPLPALWFLLFGGTALVGVFMVATLPKSPAAVPESTDR